MSRAKSLTGRAVNNQISEIKKLMVATNISRDKEQVFHKFMTDEGEKSQEDIIRLILAGRNTFSILPTGTGKTVCFQMPAIFSEGITIVISPLVALINDQVKSFNQRYGEGNKNAIMEAMKDSFILPKAVTPQMDSKTVREMLDDIVLKQKEAEEYRSRLEAGEKPDCRPSFEYKLLYLSPERLAKENFRRLIKDYLDPAGDKKINISNVIIDEVHCMSQWGFDFRESYLNIPAFLGMLKDNPPISVFTATATPMDIHDICTVLEFNEPGFGYDAKKKDCTFIRCYQRRENLKVFVIDCKAPDTDNSFEIDRAELNSAKRTKHVNIGKKYQRLTHVKYLLKENGDERCIIYCRTIERVKRLCEQLEAMEEENFKPIMYHAEMSREKRTKNAEKFKNGDKNILIATLAYGMGIDNDNVRMIIHYDVPTSLEEYYQEIGRAGRDGKESKCYLLYTNGLNLRSQKTGERYNVFLPGFFSQNLMWFINKKDYVIESKPIASRFSPKVRDRIRYMELFRLALVYDYCENFKTKDKWQEDRSYSQQNYILDMFNGKLNVAEIINNFSEYLETVFEIGYSEINDFYPGAPAIKSLISRNESLNWYYSDRTELPPEEKELQKDVLTALKEINELHINNTLIANEIKWHPERIEYGERCERVIDEWKRKKMPEKNRRIDLISSEIRDNLALVYIPTGERKMWYKADVINALWSSRASHKKTAEILLVISYDEEEKETYLVKAVYYFDKTTGKWAVPDKNKAKEDPYMGHGVTQLIPENVLQPWKEAFRKEDKDNYFCYVTGKRSRKIAYKIDSITEPGAAADSGITAPLEYFDMCVLDAIYTIILSGREIIYVKTIWELLSGKPEVRFSRANSRIKTHIEESIERLNHTNISIWDENINNAEHFLGGPMLELQDRPGKERGYDYKKGYIPVLFEYAEKINGEIIKIPANLLNCELMVDIGTGKPSNEDRSYTSSVENAVLMHYLMQRIMIYKKSGRARIVRYETIERIIAPYRAANKKTESILEKLRRILSGYIVCEFVFAIIRLDSIKLDTGDGSD